MTINEVERTVFDACFKAFPHILEPKTIVQLRDGFMKFIEKYHS